MYGSLTYDIRTMMCVLQITEAPPAEQNKTNEKSKEKVEKSKEKKEKAKSEKSSGSKGMKINYHVTVIVILKLYSENCTNWKFWLYSYLIPAAQ